MAWKIEIDNDARKAIKKLDKQIQRRIVKFLREKLIKHSNPRQLGAPLQGKLKSFWKYRIGDYRLICEIQDETITILVINVGHRKDVYDD